MKRTKNIVMYNGGFTLVELMAAIAIMAIILVPLTMVSLSGITTYYHEQEKIELMESGQFTLFKISKQIRMSNQQVASDVHYITVALSDGSYTYQLSGTSMVEIKDGTTNPIAENITEFDVSKSEDLLTIDLELTGPKYGERVNLKTSIYLRNQ
jgi:prepilin-type N-terminal cleavage/methylation domain-containing protein